MSFWGLLKTRCLIALDERVDVLVHPFFRNAEHMGDEFLLGADGCGCRHHACLVVSVSELSEGEATIRPLRIKEVLLPLGGKLDGLAVQLLVLHGCPLYSWPTMLRR